MEEGTPKKSNAKRRFRVGSKECGPITATSIASGARKLVIQHISIFQWLPKYQKEDAVCDIIAGITIGLTMLPQSIAYALLAGLSPQYGLYSSFVGTLIYILLGTVKEVSIGPTSLMALLTFEYTHDLSIDFVVLLTFLSGCVELLFGVLHLGVLVDFISAPVVSGFTTATAIVIAEAQMKGLLGIKYKSVGFVDNTWKLFSNLQHTKLGDALLGVASIIFLLTFRKLKDIPIGQPKKTSDAPCDKTDWEIQINDSKESHGKVKRALWCLTIARNALIVIIGGTLAFIFENKYGKAPFKLSGQIDPGFPPWRSPPFSTIHGNVTYNFGEMVTEMRSGIIILPVVAVLANVAIAKAYSTGGKMFATQEMVTLGVCNIAGSFVSSMPTCGAFTRSAVSSASGVRTPLAGLYTGSLIILALGFLTPYFYYIPRSTLSAVLICAVAFMTDFNIFKKLWYANKRDFFAAIVTFVVCLVIGLEVGLLLGVAINCAYLLYLWARPEINVEHKRAPSSHEYLLITPDAGLYFPSIEFVRMEICRIGISEGGGVLPVVLSCLHFKGIDYSAVKGMAQLLKEFKGRQQPIVLLNLKEEALTMLEDCGIDDVMHCSCEEELDNILFGDCLGNEDDIMLENSKKIFEGEVSLPLLERQLVLEQSGEKSGKKSVQ